MARIGRMRLVTATAAGAIALGAVFTGTAQAAPADDSGDSLRSKNFDDADSDDDAEEFGDEDRESDEDEGRGSDEDRESDEDPDRGSDQNQDRGSEHSDGKERGNGVYGVERDPRKFTQDNLDGRTDTPGVHQDGIGTVEVPSIKSG